MSVAKVDKVDIKKDDKVALFDCVFLETKRKRKSAHCLSVFYIEIFDFDKL